MFSRLNGAIRHYSSLLPNVSQPPKYVLTSIRAFPSLEPQTIVPINNEFLNSPIRRDLIWRSVVFEADRAHKTTRNPYYRSTLGYSRHKLRPQKGSGKARVGDNNSPTRHSGAVAHAINYTHDFSTDLPRKIYSRGMRIALSEQYRQGKVYVIGNEEASDPIDFSTNSPLATKDFIAHHQLEKQNLLFVLNDETNNQNLIQSTTQFDDLNEQKIRDINKQLVDDRKDQVISVDDYHKQRIRPYKRRCVTVLKEDLEIRDILRANKIFMEYEALQYLFGKYNFD